MTEYIGRRSGPAMHAAAGLGLIITWLLFGELAVAMKDRTYPASLVVLLHLHHASDTLVAAYTSAVPSLLSALVVPVIGFRSDRLRSRWGRRLPYMFALAPATALSMAALGYCSQLGAHTSQLLGWGAAGADRCALAWIFACLLVFHASGTAIFVLYAGLLNDVLPKAMLGRIYGGIRGISLGVGIAFNLWLFELTDDYLREVFVGVGLFFGAGAMLMCWQLRHAGAAAAAGPAPPAAQAMVATYWRECFKDRYYLTLFATLTCAELAFMPVNTFCQLHALSLGVSKDALGKLLALSYLTSMCLSFPIGWLVDRYGAARVSRIAVLLYCLVALVGFAWVHDQASFSVVFFGHAVVSGTYFTAAGSLPMAWFPRERFLQFEAARRLFGCAATIVLSFLLGPLLDASGHRYGLTLLAGALVAGCCLPGFMAVARQAQGDRQT